MTFEGILVPKKWKMYGREKILFHSENTSIYRYFQRIVEDGRENRKKNQLPHGRKNLGGEMRIAFLRNASSETFALGRDIEGTPAGQMPSSYQ